MFEIVIIFTSIFVFIVMVKGLRRLSKMREFEKKTFDAEIIKENRAKAECLEVSICHMFDNLK